MRCLDLFAGIGGMRLGFERAGFETVFSNDIEQACKITYDANFSTPKLTIADITTVDSNLLPNFDVLIGGFPCQPFSIAGYREGFNDSRGNLFFEIARILKDKAPNIVFLENVKNLRTHDKGNTLATILHILADLGYYVKYDVLNSMNIGNVPQNRERIYIIGFKSKAQYNSFNFPTPIPLTRTVQEGLEQKVGAHYYYNKSTIYEQLKPFVVEEGTVYQWRRKYVRENKKKVCPTLTANMGTGGHNVPIIYDGIDIRKLTPRECLRLQGFPDSYILPNLPDSKLYKQIGNSVTVSVIERIAKKILK